MGNTGEEQKKGERIKENINWLVGEVLQEELVLLLIVECYIAL